MLVSGANAPVAGSSKVQISLAQPPAGMEVDISAFLLADNSRVKSDAGMIFYGQPRSTDGSVVQDNAGPAGSAFTINLDSVPADIDRIALTATIHEGAERRQNFGQVRDLVVRIGSGAPEIVYQVPTSGMTEAALILGEFYRRNGQWKFRAVGQGFNGGLKPLAEFYGVSVDDAPAAASPAPAASAPPPVQNSRIDLTKKKIIDLAKRDPLLAESAEKARISLEKKGQAGTRAKVALVLDISGSMAGLFRSGSVDALVRRVMALGFQMDDDGDIDVFLFGKNAHDFGALNESTYKTFTRDMQREYDLESHTMYGEAIEMVRNFYRNKTGGLPVYVMFVTDGGTQDTRKSTDGIIAAAREPLFWQFMAIGRKEPPKKSFMSMSKALPRGFDFLEMLDEMPGRYIDNASFFAVEDPGRIPDEELYDLMFEEFPDWLKLAREKGLVTAS